MNDKPTIRTLTRDDVVQWYGDQGRQPTFKGFAAEIDGKLVGVAGTRFVDGVWFAFCDLDPTMSKWKTAIHRTAVGMLRDAQKRHKRLFAVQNCDISTSHRWLTRLGFEQLDGDLWQWQE